MQHNNVHNCNVHEHDHAISVYMLKVCFPATVHVDILSMWMCCPACPQATMYKSDFEQERSDRQDAMGRFEGEREAFQADIENLNEKMKAKHLELDDALSRVEQMKELSVMQKGEVRIPTSLRATLAVCTVSHLVSCCGVCECVCVGL